MKLVEQHIIKRNHSNYQKLEELTMLSSNLYNSAILQLDNIILIEQENSIYAIFVLI